MANPKARAFKISKSSKAGILLKEDSVAVIGDPRNFIVCDDHGVTIKGPVSFVNDSLNRRTAGLFVGINDFLEMIPQTIVTPIPSKIPFPPIFAVVGILTTVAFFTALLM